MAALVAMVSTALTGGSLATAAGAAQVARVRASSLRGPVVQAMVVGRGAVLMSARPVMASGATVSVGGRRCAVAPGTALATLSSARRAGGPSFALRDYGRCSSSPRDSGQLFVTAIGPDRNRGRDGWVYKVDDRAAGNGAADSLGPFGDGRRLHPGQHVLWFWCTSTRAASGCQRTLSVRIASPRVAPGSPLAVSVLAFDDAGRGVAVAGATVTLDGNSTQTAANGQATLIAPAAPGSHAVSATAPGMVPSFPQPVAIG